MDCVWKTLPMADYSVNNLGQVKNNKTNKILKGRKDKDGYLAVALYNNNVVTNCRIHRLVAKMFLEDYQDSLFVDHINRIVDDNNVLNLRMATNSQNQFNVVKRNQECTSKYKGVSFNKNKQKWVAYLCINKKKYFWVILKKKMKHLMLIMII